MKKRKFEWGYLLILPGIGYILFMIFMAIYMMVMQSFGFYNYIGESSFSLEFWQHVINQQFIDSLFFSLKIGVLSSLCSILICYVLANYLQNAWGGKTLLTIIRIPYFIPALVAAFLIANVIDYHGILNQFLMGIHLIDEPLRLRNDDWGLGVLFIQIWKNVPFQMIIMYSAIESIRKDVLDAARNLGAGRVVLMKDIIIPITLPSAFIAVIMVFIGTFNDFAISSTAGPMYPVSLAALMHSYAYVYYDWNTSACIGVLMLLITVLGVIGYTWLQKKLERML
ncbi:ABC transporter permease [Oscillibacter sp.]|uniref:ABC transporter permease n=1 Tax=Oscillibacter sp. TaxID=1945593 RepID=UPI002D80C732|nr:ABC transporter permease subunit [Oscillibacter sp.]